MKIAFDYQIFCMQRYGGISRYFYELNKNLPQVSDAAVASKIVAPLFVNEYLAKYSDASKSVGRKLPNIKGAAPISSLFSRILSPLILRFESPNIIHRTYYFSDYRMGKGLGRSHRPLSVLTVYDMIHERFSADFSPKDKTRASKLNAVADADHVICISENTRRDLLEITGIDPDKVSVSYLGFSLDTSSTGDQANCSLPTSRPYLLYVGNRRGYKNFNALLKVFASSERVYKDFDLVLFGGGSLTATELDLFRRHLVDSERVHYVEGNDDILAALYRGAAAFVYPSLYEGFGIPPLEAMSFGCPVVCSNTSSMPEVVGDAAALFDPTDSDDLLDALELVLYDADARAGLISRGYERITRFSWLKCAEQTYNIYKKALS